MKYDFLTDEENRKVNFLFDEIEKQFQKKYFNKTRSRFYIF